MNWMKEHEEETLAKARAEIAAKDAAWAALTDEERAAALEANRKEREAEDRRQERIALQYEEMFGPDDADENEGDEE